MLKEGQVFYTDYAKPEGLCDEAWKAIYQYVFALSHGAGEGLFYYGDWIRRPGVAICSCNDGLRPGDLQAGGHRPGVRDRLYPRAVTPDPLGEKDSTAGRLTGPPLSARLEGRRRRPI